LLKKESGFIYSNVKKARPPTINAAIAAKGIDAPRAVAALFEIVLFLEGLGVFGVGGLFVVDDAKEVVAGLDCAVLDDEIWVEPVDVVETEVLGPVEVLLLVVSQGDVVGGGTGLVVELVVGVLEVTVLIEVEVEVEVVVVVVWKVDEVGEDDGGHGVDDVVTGVVVVGVEHGVVDVVCNVVDVVHGVEDVVGVVHGVEDVVGVVHGVEDAVGVEEVVHGVVDGVDLVDVVDVVHGVEDVVGVLIVIVVVVVVYVEHGVEDVVSVVHGVENVVDVSHGVVDVRGGSVEQSGSSIIVVKGLPGLPNVITSGSGRDTINPRSGIP